MVFYQHPSYFLFAQTRESAISSLNPCGNERKYLPLQQQNPPRFPENSEPGRGVLYIYGNEI